MPHAETRARRFVHLAEDQDRFVQHAGGLDFAIQFLALAAALADSAEDADAAMMADGVVDQLRDQHRFADAGSAEQAALASALEWSQNVDGLDSGREDFGGGGALH